MEIIVKYHPKDEEIKYKNITGIYDKGYCYLVTRRWHKIKHFTLPKEYYSLIIVKSKRGK